MIGVTDGLLTRIASSPRLLVACDFDGVLSEIAPTPGSAVIDDRCAAALRSLASLDRTHAAVVSGRGLDDLAALTVVLGDVIRVGSHGAERDGAEGWRAGARDLAELGRLAEALDAIAADAPGALVERKPVSVAIHYRQCDSSHVPALLGRMASIESEFTGMLRRDGKMVIEYCASPADKGAALLALRRELGVSSILYIGDDVTDEHAFSVLRDGDLGIKVGTEPTLAHVRLQDRADVAAILERLAVIRGEWLDSAPITPIERHSLLSDQRTMAMVDPRGRLVWMCLPRADSSAVFAELVGGESCGHFSIAPASGGAVLGQEYIGGSFVLRTRWKEMSITDYLDCTGGRPYQRAGRSDLVRVVEGSGEAAVRFAPRLDFGRQATEITVRDGGLVIEGLADPLVLYSPGVQWKIEQEGAHQTATAALDLSNGPVVLELRCGFGGLGGWRVQEQARRTQSITFWEGWARTLTLPSLRPELVSRSALALKALVYGPTGAVFAAATTSLPEDIGGVRNWDYRYCWPRDACLAAASLVRLGNTGVAMKLLDWLVGVVAQCDAPERLRPLYTVAGLDLGPEAEIGELSGYGHSRPVRIGNAADHQVQLDVFGPIVDLVALLVERGAPVTPEHWRLVEAMVAAVAARWHEPDHGIWEVRGQKRHHVHTKVMCWLAAERGWFIAREVLGRERSDWDALRQAIRADVLRDGWNAQAGAFTFAYGSGELDAAALWVILSGLLAPDDPRSISTVRAVEELLRDGPVVYRYRLDDGLPGREGGFHICTSWLIECLAMQGQAGRARELFDQMAELAGPTGLLPEQYDPRAGRSLGNIPQAYSHLGLINAAVRLSASGDRAGPLPPI